MPFPQRTEKGFTLIELLVVIGIIAVLAVVVVLVINPTQLFMQARDAQRLSDLATLQRAINYTLSTASTITLLTGPYVTSGTTCSFSSGCPGTNRSSTATDSSGWVALDFTQAAGGSPLARLPLDPKNTGNYYYTFKSNGNSSNPLYEIDARFESANSTATDPVTLKYQDLMNNDGGDKPASGTCFTYTQLTCWYEVGNSLTL